MNQTEAILEHLKAGNTITPLEALDRFGCFRLAARCADLRKEGYNIITENVTRNGKTFAEYRLMGGYPRQIPANSFKTQPELLSVPTIPIVTHV